ncbi:unnamed protein product [Miscanthus lutarioriparius]|uniref:[RNA-polymerase]-subunit kinase n=1 Tax=Miscanthus lutarioriparius TaxID=422564 RepID=A0A811QGH4_9POAL|nr:unnamed protein product [Miscanthus lutarioriparius]
MALDVIVHRKRPAPSRAKKAGKKQRRRRRYYKMPSEEYYYEFRFDDDIGDDMVEVSYEFDFDSIDRYEMLEEFGPSDTDPAVAEARDRSTGETVAVKRVRPSQGDGGAERLCAVVREARCLDACLGHSSTLQLRGMAADDKTGDLFIVTEQLLGSGCGGASTLRSRLTRPFSEAETRALMRQLLGAVEKMHGAGVTHRDINPDNIVVGASGVFKVSGFRCAITPAERFLGEPHPPMGALRYCSPHQLNGLRCYCPAEDVWALGCVMAELLAVAPLFTADAQEDLLGETIDLRDEIVNFGADAFDGVLEEVSLAGRELLAGLLAFDASERPTAADALKHRWFAENDVAKAKSRVVRAYKQR